MDAMVRVAAVQGNQHMGVFDMMRRSALQWLGAALPVAAIALASLTSYAGDPKKTAEAAGEKAAGEVKKEAYGAMAGKDIVDTAVGNKDFSTLVELLKEAGLVETLKGEGPFTVFAPTNEAFKKISPADLDALKQDRAKLKSVLTYHVVPGKHDAAAVTKLTSVKTVQGSEATVKVTNGKVMIDGATVTKTDIKCSNGVIHVIDTVIMPKATGNTK
jgi:uncharacterized surface protein with fasciclin (FAS1) repeats